MPKAGGSLYHAWGGREGPRPPRPRISPLRRSLPLWYLPFMTDGFRTVTFRVDPPTRTAVTDFPCVLHAGDDSLIFVFANVYGIDPDTCAAGLFSPSDPTQNLGAFSGFAFVPGDTSAAWCRADLTSRELGAALAPSALGECASLRLYLKDAVRTWLDTDVPVCREPLSSADPASPASGYITAAQLAAAAAAVSEMPALTAAQREARFAALLAALEALA